MKPIKGRLHLYFATGEWTHAQFIGHKNKNLSQVYSIDMGDKISFSDNGEPVDFHMINNIAFLGFLRDMAFFCKNIDVFYVPHKSNKSWGYQSKAHLKTLKNKS